MIDFYICILHRNYDFNLYTLRINNYMIFVYQCIYYRRSRKKELIQHLLVTVHNSLQDLTMECILLSNCSLINDHLNTGAILAMLYTQWGISIICIYFYLKSKQTRISIFCHISYFWVNCQWFTKSPKCCVYHKRCKSDICFHFGFISIPINTFGKTTCQV